MRTARLAFFYIAIPLGSALGYIVGGQVASVLGSWRWALRVSPPLGLILAVIIMIFTTDPPRGHSDNQAALVLQSVSGKAHGIRGLIADVRHIFAIRSFLWATAGFTSVTFAAGALAQWAPTFISRQCGWSSSNSSLFFGGITVFTGIVGTALGSIISKHVMRTDPRADGLVCGFGLLLCTPFLAFALALPTWNIWAAWFLVFVAEVGPHPAASK